MADETVSSPEEDRKAAKQVRARAYYAANKEVIKARVRAWTEANPERKKSARRQRYVKQRESLNQATHQWYIKNRDRVKAREQAKRAANLETYRRADREKARRNQLKNPIAVRARRDRWAKANPEKQKLAIARWTLHNRERINARVRERTMTEPAFRLRRVLRSRVHNAIKKGKKGGSAITDLGCTLDQLKIYLESQFLIGMNWGNYGSGYEKWCIDHIKPLSQFDLTNREQFMEAANFRNLQPMWWIENTIKGARSHT